MVEKECRRKYFRIRPRSISYNTFKIHSFRGKMINSKPATFRLHDLSREGLKFSSALLLPVSDEMLMEFNIKLPRKTIKAKGHLVYRNKMGDYYTYGAHLIDSNIDMLYFLDLAKDSLLWLKQKEIVIK